MKILVQIMSNGTILTEFWVTQSQKKLRTAMRNLGYSEIPYRAVLQIEAVKDQ